MPENQPFAIRQLYEDYIFGTDPLELIENKKIVIGALPQNVIDGAGLVVSDVCLGAIALKHIHLARSDQHFEIILDNLHYFISDPEALYLNKPTKKGTHILLRKLGDERYFLCALEVMDQSNSHFEIVTVAPCKPEKYFKSYKQLWNREDA